MSGIALRVDDNLSVLHTFGGVNYIRNKQPINNFEKFPSELNLDDIIKQINGIIEKGIVDEGGKKIKLKLKYTKENLIVACKVDNSDDIAFIPFGHKINFKENTSHSNPNLIITTEYLFNPIYYKKFIPSLKNVETFLNDAETRINDPIVGLFEVTIDKEKKYLLLFKEDSELKSTGTQHEINGLENYNNFPFLVKNGSKCGIWTKKNNIAGVYIIDSNNFSRDVKSRIDKVYGEIYNNNFEISFKNKLTELRKIKFNYDNFKDVMTLEKLTISYPKLKNDDYYQDDYYQDDNGVDFNEFNLIPEMVLILHDNKSGEDIDFNDLLAIIDSMVSLEPQEIPSQVE